MNLYNRQEEEAEREFDTEILPLGPSPTMRNIDGQTISSHIATSLFFSKKNDWKSRASRKEKGFCKLPWERDSYMKHEHTHSRPSSWRSGGHFWWWLKSSIVGIRGSSNFVRYFLVVVRRTSFFLNINTQQKTTLVKKRRYILSNVATVSVWSEGGGGSRVNVAWTSTSIGK